MASVGTRINGLVILTSLCLKEPSAALRMTLPAKVRSLSNQVCHSPLPYVCTFSIWWPDLKVADLGLSLRHGLSVWAAIILKPFPTLYLQQFMSVCQCVQCYPFIWGGKCKARVNKKEVSGLTFPQWPKGDQAGHVAREEVASTGLQVPVITLAEQLEARVEKLPLGLSWNTGMEEQRWKRNDWS